MTTAAKTAMETLQNDPDLAPYVVEHGPLTLDPAENLFERLVRSLVRQQISMDAADAIHERLSQRFELTPQVLVDAEPEVLEAAGLSGAKVEYLKALSTAFLENEYSREYFSALDDERVLRELTAIRGVGPWTGKMFLMFGLGREDVFPVEDLGVRRGMEVICREDMTRGEMCDRAREWQPYRSYASLYLWRAYEG